MKIRKSDLTNLVKEVLNESVLQEGGVRDADQAAEALQRAGMAMEAVYQWTKKQGPSYQHGKDMLKGLRKAIMYAEAVEDQLAAGTGEYPE